jgi:hypothetical protein
MSEETQILNFNDAIAALNSVSESFKIDAWIPSLKKTLTFKEIDAKQQKSLLSAAMDNSVYNSEFIKSFYNILKENLLNEDKSIVDNFTIVDKYFIGITLRSQISEEIRIKFTDEITEKVKLEPLISNFRNYNLPDSDDLVIKNEVVTIICNVSLPSVKDEVDYEEQFYKKYKNIDDVKSTKDVQGIISDAFIGETSKYINYMLINDSKFNFKTMTLDQKIKVVEKLPSTLIQKILDKVSNWKKEIDSFLTVSAGDKTKVISVDSLLFLS